MAAGFVGGVIFLGSLVASLFFLRFWVRSRDRLFVIFALAFALLAANRLVLLVIDEASDARTYVYLVRLLAFVLIAVAIVDKNRSAHRGSG